ncbi:MAG: aminoimidazole riboside kinase [Rouxiella aceris]|uniref:aminoimidazole riboside kinase n=1 Tax=Rouxiella aceris TaxID=2703884 RepID=UPI00283F5D22|nr:aminoimidazole riboside kinase [Rouxiella aceris]MDR3432139.1 aminoimidazole riboside kinase [Rouxiella aceris]
MKNRIWVLGDAVVDLIPEADGRLLQCPGGAPANVAVGISRLGGDSAFIGRVGGDPFGKFLLKTLDDEGVNTQFMQLDPDQRTSTVVVANDADGERSFTFMVRPGADLFLQAKDLPTFNAGQFLHLCSIALSAEPSRSTALLAMTRMRAAGGHVCFDPNIRLDLWADEDELRDCLDQALALADIIKISQEELAYLTGEVRLSEGILRLCERHNPELLLVTQGKNGVLVYRRKDASLTQYPAPQVKALDTTGAGDAFVAGLLAGLAQHWPVSSEQIWQQIIRQALACGALATTAKGAMTALPNSLQLAAFYSSTD